MLFQNVNIAARITVYPYIWFDYHKKPVIYTYTKRIAWYGINLNILYAYSSVKFKEKNDRLFMYL